MHYALRTAHARAYEHRHLFACTRAPVQHHHSLDPLELRAELRSATLLASARRLRRLLRKGHTQLLVGLISSICLNDVNHENICVLNTTMLLLIHANRQGLLAETLQSIDEFDYVPVYGKGRPRAYEIHGATHWICD